MAGSPCVGGEGVGVRYIEAAAQHTRSRARRGAGVRVGGPYSSPWRMTCARAKCVTTRAPAGWHGACFGLSPYWLQYQMVQTIGGTRAYCLELNGPADS